MRGVVQRCPQPPMRFIEFYHKYLCKVIYILKAINGRQDFIGHQETEFEVKEAKKIKKDKDRQKT